MSLSGKWIDGIRPEGTVCDAARVSLSTRLAAVAYWLPLAAEHAEQDVEHVHRLRVSTRRAIAALKLYHDWLPRKPRSWLKKRLKKIRRAAGDARDLDVLAERIREHSDSNQPALQEVATRRAAAQPAIVRAAEKCRRDDRLLHKTHKLLQRIESPRSHHDSGTPVIFRDWAREQLTGTADDFFAALPENDADTATLHQFRIRAKALRYTMELVAPAFDTTFRETHYPVVEKLQERLGEINDCVAMRTRLDNWSEASDDPSKQNTPPEGDAQNSLAALAAHEAARIDELLPAFRAWWTAERIESLRVGLSSPTQQLPLDTSA